MDGPRIKRRIDDELSALANNETVTVIRSLLVEPELVLREWNYPGWRGAEEGMAYECWTVLKHAPTDTGICYSQQGFGPENPWGLVFLTGDPARLSMGADFGWYPTFLQAFAEFCAERDLVDR